MASLKNASTRNPAQFSPAATSNLDLVDRSSGFRLQRLRHYSFYPATVSLLYVFGGLCWLLAVNPILANWLYGTPSSPLSDQLPNILAIIASGGLFYWLLRTHDKTAHRTKRAQDIRLVEFIEQITDVAFVKDRQGRYALFNSAGARLAGRPAIECVNQDDSALFPAEVAHKLMEDDRRVIAGGTLLSCKDTFTIRGDTRVFLSTKWPYRDADGNIIGVIGIARDITEQKQIEERLRRARDDLDTRVRERTAELLTINRTLERQIAARVQAEIALRESEERFRQMAEHIREVFWVFGIEEERLLYVSPAYEEVWGQPIAGLQERPLEWIEAVHPDDRPRVQAAHLAKRKLGHLDEEYRIVRPDGTIRWIWDRGFPVHIAAFPFTTKPATSIASPVWPKTSPSAN